MYWFQTPFVLFLAAPAVHAVFQQFPGNVLDKRDDACYIDADGNSYTCDIGYACCGSVIAECIPEDAVCCDTGDQIGYCDAGQTCSLDTDTDLLVCLDSNSSAAPAQTSTQIFAPVSTTAATVTSSHTLAPVTTVGPTTPPTTQQPAPTPSGSAVTLKLGASVLLTFQLVGVLLLW